jgi:TonB family protein
LSSGYSLDPARESSDILQVKTAFFFTAALVWTLTAHGQGKPVVYNNAESGDTPLDRAVKKAYAPDFTIIDVTTAAGYESPRPTVGGLPRTAKNDEGEPLEGYVLAAYLISEKGLVEHPIVLRSTHEDLSRTALAAMETWRFVPGTVKGKPVATTAAQEFTFEILKHGFETTNIVLYQPDDVIQKRLPGTGHLAAYLEKIQRATEQFFAQTHAPGSLQIVVAIRPGGKSRVWLTGSGIEEKTLAALREQLGKIPPVAVQDGPVAFAICGTIADGPETGDPTPMPPEWQEAVKKLPQPVAVPDGLLDAVWPEK